MTTERRWSYTLQALDADAPFHRYFESQLVINPSVTGSAALSHPPMPKPSRQGALAARRLAVDFPQTIGTYERTAELELWELRLI